MATRDRGAMSQRKSVSLLPTLQTTGATLRPYAKLGIRHVNETTLNVYYVEKAFRLPLLGCGLR